MSVHILHAHSTFAADTPWAARSVRLMNAFGDGVEHTVICALPDQMSAGERIVRKDRVRFAEDAPPLCGRPGLRRLFRLARYARGYDLVLTYGSAAFDMVMAHHLFRGPPLIHHEDGFHEGIADPLGAGRSLYRRLGLSSAYRLVVTSRRMERIARTSWGLPGDRVVRIADGVPVENFGRPAPHDNGWSGDGQLVVGTLARLVPSSNLTGLVRAVAAMKTGNIRLVIVGAGPESERIMEEARRCGIAQRVLLPGPLDPAAALACFHIFAQTGWSEQFPTPLVEAMAAGLPAVATAEGEVAEIVAADNLPLIVDPDDEPALAAALDTLADRADLRRAIGRANREKARAEFDEKDMLSRHSRLYGEAIGAPRGFIAASA